MPEAAHSVRRTVALLGRTQLIWSLGLALIPIFFLATLGITLFAAPSRFLEKLLNCFHDNYNNPSPPPLSPSLLDLQLARVVGCVFLGQTLSAASLLYPTVSAIYASTSTQSLFAGNPKDEVTLDKFRSVLASLALIGLLLIVGGLVDDRTSDRSDDASCTSIQSTIIIGSGAVTLTFACGSMMFSFWSPTPSTTESNNDTDSVLPQTIEGGELSAPLLPSGDPTNEDTEGPSEAMVETTESEEPTSRIRGTKRLLKLAAPQVFYLYVGCAVLLVRLPFSLAIPHFVSTALGAVSRGDFAGARVEVLLLFILGTIDAALDFWCVFLFGYANLRIVRGVRIGTFVSILRQEVAFFDKTTSGELASRLNSDCGEMAGDLTWFFRFSIESVVRITGIVSYMLIRCPILGACALTIVPAVAVVNKAYSRFLSKNAAEVQEALACANQVAQETFSCIRTVIAFASEQEQERKYTTRIDDQYELSVRQLYIQGVYYMAVSTFLINTVVQGTLLLIGTSLIQHGKLTGEILLAFMLYQGQLQSETMNLFQSYTSLVKSSGAGDKVFSLLDRRPAAPGTGSADVLSTEVGNPSSQPDSANHHQDQIVDRCVTSSNQTGDSKLSCTVDIVNVDFTYPCRPDNSVLEKLNLNIPQGKTVALVGASGCGKSTVVGLLQRYYDPRGGSILVDNVDLRDLDVKLHRRRIGVVTQDPILFHGTIFENIVYGCDHASREDAEEAARLANAWNFINSFPDKFETDVGERGVQLSGGQKQRIAIARAIVRRPVLLLLDEATSALDAESEQAVQDALDSLLKTNSDMTTVVVAHRLRTVRNADIIAFIGRGRVIESGSHDELINKNGHYSRMVERASSGGQLPDH